MNLISFDFTLILYSLFCIILGIIVAWFYMKKTILSQLLENQTVQKSFNEVLQKNEALLMEKMEIDKQLAGLKQ